MVRHIRHAHFTGMFTCLLWILMLGIVCANIGALAKFDVAVVWDVVDCVRVLCLSCFSPSVSPSHTCPALSPHLSALLTTENPGPRPDNMMALPLKRITAELERRGLTCFGCTEKSQFARLLHENWNLSWNRDTGQQEVKPDPNSVSSQKVRDLHRLFSDDVDLSDEFDDQSGMTLTERLQLARQLLILLIVGLFFVCVSLNICAPWWAPGFFFSSLSSSLIRMYSSNYSLLSFPHFVCFPTPGA